MTRLSQGHRRAAPRAIILLLIFMLLDSRATVIAAPHQNAQEKIDLDAINKIREAALHRSQVMEMASYLTDVMGARLTGSPALKAAQEWAKNELSEWGLRNAHLEAYPFGRGWSLEGFAANMLKPQFSPLIAYPKAWSPSTNGTVRGRVIYFDVKTEAELEKYKGKLKGAIVAMFPPRDVKTHFAAQARRATDAELQALANAKPPSPEPQRFTPSPAQRAGAELAFKKWQFLTAEGVAVILQPGSGDQGTVFVQQATVPAPIDMSFDERPKPWDKNPGAITPQVMMAAEHYNRILRLIAQGVPVELELNINSRFYDQDLMSYNVIAEIPGTDLKDEVVMLGGCIDSWHAGTGATDNAAGAVVCLEAMRILQSLGLRPRRTIRIGLWSGEEQGTYGSRAYVAEYFGKRVAAPGNPSTNQPSTSPPFDLKPAHEKFSCYFNLDYGTGKLRGVYLQGNEAVRPIFSAWLAPFKDMGAATLSILNIGSTDHVPFDELGLPAFQFLRDDIEYETRTHHTNMDVYERLQEDDLKQATAIVAAFVYNAAMRDQKLPRKPQPRGSL